MIIKGKAYDAIRWFAQIVLPALGTFYASVAGIWGLPAADQVVGTILALVTLLGVILGISKVSYDRSDAKYDGELNIREGEDGRRIAALELKKYEDPGDVVNQKELLFKVNNHLDL